MTKDGHKDYSAIILVAGDGRRMAANQNKIFLTIKDKPIFEYALEVFLSDSDCQQVILVGKNNEAVRFIDFLSERVIFVPGGEERQDSVRHAFAYVSQKRVMIHDGARPFLTLADINALKQHDNAILAVPVKDTIKQVGEDSHISRTISREDLWCAQTPQFFEWEVIKEAHLSAYSSVFSATDDASLVEHFLKVPVTIVPGSYENIKITTPEDLIFGEAILAHRSED